MTTSAVTLSGYLQSFYGTSVQNNGIPGTNTDCCSGLSITLCPSAFASAGVQMTGRVVIPKWGTTTTGPTAWVDLTMHSDFLLGSQWQISYSGSGTRDPTMFCDQVLTTFTAAADTKTLTEMTGLKGYLKCSHIVITPSGQGTPGFLLQQADWSNW